jgi:superfamily II DNA or RNA helicase
MLTSDERLQLQQLRLLDWCERARGSEMTEVVEAEEETTTPPAELWNLTGELELREWQISAVDSWFAAGRRGTIKVVTGAGKTVAALAVIERLHLEDPELRVAVVVPTIVLMDQWFDALTSRSGLSSSAVGRLGGGHRDSFSSSRRILIAVLASAHKDLPSIVRSAGISDHLLLIVDESHRAGAPQMSAVLQTPRGFSLGLSATPERSEGDAGGEETDVLWAELGEIVFEMTFADAIRDGILPPFRLDHYGLPLNSREAQRYQSLTRSINEARKELAKSPAARKAGGDALIAVARRISSGKSGLSAVAARFVNDTTRRKQLLYHTQARTAAALELVRGELEARPDARIILFHESIDDVVGLYEGFVRSGIPAVMEHSELPAELRETSLALFRAGTAQVIASARSLIEGFNVPEADLGIVVASSSSPRQRIQSIGRVLRKHRGTAGEEKTSRICLLYIRDTVDEAIYERQDWERLVGLDRNYYFHWDPPGSPIEQDGPPRSAVPGEAEIDLSALSVGDRYPGRYRGEEFGTDRLGNVIDADSAIALNPQGVPDLVSSLRGGPGRFRVTPRASAILVRVPIEAALPASTGRGSQLQLGGGTDETQLALSGSFGDDWVTLYGGRLGEPFRFADPTTRSDVDVAGLRVGDAYEGPLAPAAEYRFRQRAGGTIARRVRGGEQFAHGPSAEALLAALREVSRTGEQVTRFYVNDLGHAFWREAGAARFLAALDSALEFPGHAA